MKYIGKEHYCPLSLLRVYGMTEVEEYDDHQEFENESDDAAEAAKKSAADEQDKSGYFETAKQAVVGLVNNVAETFTGKRDNNGTSRHGGDIVTLVNPDHMFDMDEANFITTCIQRTLYSEYNTSLNPIFRFGLTYVLIKRMCPSLKMFRASRLFRQTKKPKPITPIPPPPLLVQTLSETNPPSTSSSTSNKDSTKQSDGITSPSTPTTTTDQTKNIEQDMKTTTNNEKDTKHKDQSDLSQSKVEANVRDSPLHEVATTTKGSNVNGDATCSKLNPPKIDITKLVPQPSFTENHVDASSNGVEATAALKVVELKDDISITSSASSSCALKKESSPVVISTLSSVAVTTEQSVDVLEFKTNSNTDTSSMIAEKVAEDETSIPQEHHQASSDDKGKDELVEKKIVEEDSKVVPSPSSSEQLSTEQQVNIEKEEKIKKEEHVIIEPSSSVETLPSSITTTESSVTKETASISQDATSEAVQPNKAKQVQATVTTGLPASKESIIVKLNAKIKALQLNLTMSMMYLEEMSER